MKVIKRIVAPVLILGFVFIAGMICQKKYGIGNLMKLISSDYIPPSKQEHLLPNHQGNMSIYLMAGQSNMEGDGEEEIESLNDGKIYVFDENYKWIIGKEPVRIKVGPSMAIAHEISKHSNNPVGIINVAAGSTNIAQWQKSYYENSYYQKLLKRALASQAQGKIEGLFFLQGENDAEGDSTDHWDDWNLYFEKFVKDIRTDLKNDSLPIVFGQIGKGDNEFWLKVKSSQEKVSLPKVEMIKTDDIDYKEGIIHYDSKGYNTIGERFGKKYTDKFIVTPK